ncbi:MAG: hypothetical protein HS111_05070 [Kofleriaceae bacterium]|nr:hypothetical protein [Kofleriaceae bacterium]
MEALAQNVGEVAGRAAVGGKAIDYATVERTIGEKTAAIERAAHQAILRRLDVDAPKVMIDGGSWSRVGRYDATYCTMAGPVEIARSVYRRDGERNGKVVDPVSLRAGVVGDGWLPQTARAMAHHVQRGTPREAKAGAAEMGRCCRTRSRASSGSPTTSASCTPRAQVEIEDALITAYEVPSEARSAAERRPRLAADGRATAALPPGRPKKGAQRSDRSRSRGGWHGRRPSPCTTATATPRTRSGTARCPTTAPSACSTGSLAISTSCSPKSRRRGSRCHMRRRARPRRSACRRGRRPDHRPAVQVVDFWHLVEKLGAAGTPLDDDPARRLARRWRLRLLNVEPHATDILHELRTSGRERVRVGETQPVHEAITYLDNHRGRMNYAAARAAGLLPSAAAASRRPARRWSRCG